MLTIRLPASVKPVLTGSMDHNVRSSIVWQRMGGGKRYGKSAAKNYAAQHGWAAMIWQSGNVSVYAKADEHEAGDGDQLVRIRYAD